MDAGPLQVGGVFKALVVLVLLGLPLVVISALPRLFELVPGTPGGQTSTSSSPGPQQSRLSAPTATTQRSRFGALEETPPPTLVRPAATAISAATARPSSTAERIVIGNTGGIGAVLRAEPVTGRALGSLPEQKIVEVLERRNIPGSGDWVHVRTPEGQEGWVIGLVALPANRAQ